MRRGNGRRRGMRGPIVGLFNNVHTGASREHLTGATGRKVQTVYRVCALAMPG